ncbi:hypothetical protein EVAR_60917_1 [Eumeta japonica]|uniref:Uncharacterized protein n=1 Tax=Eumeta variegata TaxID=151549 RepID=A0A4C1ZK81_EUMVA|nr:hypothetical protein EVAR_60917_1 [Eumeta japonica]
MNGLRRQPAPSRPHAAATSRRSAGAATARGPSRQPRALIQQFAFKAEISAAPDRARFIYQYCLTAPGHLSLRAHGPSGDKYDAPYAPAKRTRYTLSREKRQCVSSAYSYRVRLYFRAVASYVRRFSASNEETKLTHRRVFTLGPNERRVGIVIDSARRPRTLSEARPAAPSPTALRRARAANIPLQKSTDSARRPRTAVRSRLVPSRVYITDPAFLSSFVPSPTPKRRYNICHRRWRVSAYAGRSHTGRVRALGNPAASAHSRADRRRAACTSVLHAAYSEAGLARGGLAHRGSPVRHV